MTKHPQSGKEGPEKRNSQKHSRFGDGRGGGCKGPAWHALPNFGEMVEQIENLCCWWGPGGGTQSQKAPEHPRASRNTGLPQRPREKERKEGQDSSQRVEQLVATQKPKP